MSQKFLVISQAGKPSQIHQIYECCCCEKKTQKPNRHDYTHATREPYVSPTLRKRNPLLLYRYQITKRSPPSRFQHQAFTVMKARIAILNKQLQNFLNNRNRGKIPLPYTANQYIQFSSLYQDNVTYSVNNRIPHKKVQITAQTFQESVFDITWLQLGVTAVLEHLALVKWFRQKTKASSVKPSTWSVC